MPPTYSPLWKPFEILGRLGLPRNRVDVGAIAMGPPEATDATGGDAWRQYATATGLYDLWGPPHASRWSGYHKPTLFAALDSIPKERLRPKGPLGLGVDAAPRERPRWADEHAAVVLDLDGPASVAYAAWFAARVGHTPVATFNNWPHAKGLVDAVSILGALLYYAPWVHVSDRIVDEMRAPPVFVLDRSRLGARAPKPLDFDNRYYLLSSDLPSAASLATAGIERLVYVRPERVIEPPAVATTDRITLSQAFEPPRAISMHEDMDDLNVWLHDANERLKVHIAYAAKERWEISEPRPFATAIRKTPFTTTKDPAFRGFRRNAAGGFGVLVPEPSSGGG